MYMCPDKITLSAYHDKELTENDLVVIQKHVNSCGYCTNYIKQLEGVTVSLQSAGEPDVSRAAESIKQKIMIYTEIEASREKWKPKVHYPLLGGAAVAAAALVFAFVSLFSNVFTGPAMVAGRDAVTPVSLSEKASRGPVEITGQLNLEEEGSIGNVNFRIPSEMDVRILGEPSYRKKINYRPVGE